MAGQPHFQLPVTISGIRTTGLVDSGASDNFISSKLVRLLACPKHSLKTPSTVLVGDGSPLVANSFVRVRVSLGPLVLRMCLRVLDMSPELILGYPFLYSLQPLIDWRKRSMTVVHRGKTYVLSSFRHCDFLQLLTDYPEVYSPPATLTHASTPHLQHPAPPHPIPPQIQF